MHPLPSALGSFLSMLLTVSSVWAQEAPQPSIHQLMEQEAQELSQTIARVIAAKAPEEQVNSLSELVHPGLAQADRSKVQDEVSRRVKRLSRLGEEHQKRLMHPRVTFDSDIPFKGEDRDKHIGKMFKITYDYQGKESDVNVSFIVSVVFSQEGENITSATHIFGVTVESRPRNLSGGRLVGVSPVVRDPVGVAIPALEAGDAKGEALELQ